MVQYFLTISYSRELFKIDLGISILSRFLSVPQLCTYISVKIYYFFIYPYVHGAPYFSLLSSELIVQI